VGVSVVATQSIVRVVPLVEHWDGTTWSLVTAAHLVGAQESILSVAIAAADDVWAVGSSSNVSSGAVRTLIHHWNGTKWSVVPSPNMGTGVNELVAVDAISPSNAWAVGDYFDTDRTSPIHSLIEHWDGTRWKVTTHPAGGAQDALADVARIPARSRAWSVGWAGGSTLVETSTGTTWATIPSPNGGPFPSLLAGVTATSATDAWAVGSYVDGVAKTLVERWNGTTWSVVPSPNVGSEGTTLKAVAASSPTSAWAAGQQRKDGVSRIVGERWDGSDWKVVGVPNVGVAENLVTDMAVVPGAGTAWMVGNYTDNDGSHPLIERYC
jgi:hypothetical protein